MLRVTDMPSINRIANPDYAPADHQKTTVAALTLGALGVVYGDIGTSPLYALKEVFSPSTGVLANPENVIGAVSVVLWALMLVVTLKYVLLILRADNRGEGGILALSALVSLPAGIVSSTMVTWLERLRIR